MMYGEIVMEKWYRKWTHNINGFVVPNKQIKANCLIWFLCQFLTRKGNFTNVLKTFKYETKQMPASKYMHK